MAIKLNPQRPTLRASSISAETEGEESDSIDDEWDDGEERRGGWRSNEGCWVAAEEGERETSRGERGTQRFDDGPREARGGWGGGVLENQGEVKGERRSVQMGR